MLMLLFLLTSLKATNALYNEMRNAANDVDDDEDKMRMKFFALFRSLSLSLLLSRNNTNTNTNTTPFLCVEKRRDAGRTLSLSLSTQKRDFLYDSRRKEERRDPKREKHKQNRFQYPKQKQTLNKETLFFDFF